MLCNLHTAPNKTNMIFINVGNCDTELWYITLPLSCLQVSLQQTDFLKVFCKSFVKSFSLCAGTQTN